jgi:hypothetical protein
MSEEQAVSEKEFSGEIKQSISSEAIEEDKFRFLPQKDVFRIDEVARYFEVEDQTIRTWLAHGYFEVEKLHGTLRITRRSIINFRLRSGKKFR